MPWNNPVKLWDETQSPYKTVAFIRIPKQTFDLALVDNQVSPNPQRSEQEQFCEDLSFTPWHSVEEHQPIGSIEVTRKVIYDHISELRHRLNGRKRVEPTGSESFPPNHLLENNP